MQGRIGGHRQMWIHGHNLHCLKPVLLEQLLWTCSLLSRHAFDSHNWCCNEIGHSTPETHQVKYTASLPTSLTHGGGWRTKKEFSAEYVVFYKWKQWISQWSRESLFELKVEMKSQCRSLSSAEYPCNPDMKIGNALCQAFGRVERHTAASCKHYVAR